MKTGWTVALVIAASLSAQTAVAADAKPGDLQFAALLKLLSGTSLVAADSTIADALVLTAVTAGLDFCSGSVDSASMHPGCPPCGCLDNPSLPAGLLARQLLKFDIEVRGP